MLESFEKSPLSRFVVWLLLAVGLIVTLSLFSPQQLPVVLYKLALVTVAIVLGYALDRGIFPYARPHKLMGQVDQSDVVNVLDYHLLACLCMWRRAVIIFACVLGMTLGL